MKILSIFILIIFIVSCTPSTEVHFFNNSGDDIVLKFESRNKSWKIKANEKGNFYSEFSTFTVITQGKVFEYPDRLNILSPPDDLDGYIKKYFPMGFKVRLQFEKNGNIYIVPKSKKFPLEAFNEQPSLFPILPLEK